MIRLVQLIAANRQVQLVAKLVGWAAVCLWVLGYLMVGILLVIQLPVLLAYMDIQPGITYFFLVIWLVVTMAITGSLVVLRGLRLVGKWENPSDEDTE